MGSRRIAFECTSEGSSKNQNNCIDKEASAVGILPTIPIWIRRQALSGGSFTVFGGDFQALNHRGEEYPLWTGRFDR